MSQTVLLADPDPVFRRLLSLIFTTSGQYRYLEATTGPEALALSAKQPPNLAVVDACLPPEDGLHLSVELRRLLGSNVRIVIMARRGHALLDKGSSHDGPDRVIEKPFSPRSLVSIIEGLLLLSMDEPEPVAVPSGYTN